MATPSRYTFPILNSDGTASTTTVDFADMFVRKEDFLDAGLYAWGQNVNTQLGLNNTTNISSPTQVGSLTNWKQVSNGYSHTTSIRTDGSLWTWGYNFYGQLGINSIIQVSSPTQVGSLYNWKQVSGGYLHSAAIKSDSTLWTWGLNSKGELGVNDITHRSSPVQVGSLTNWKQVSSSSYTSAIATTGALYAWGDNTFGKLGIGTATFNSAVSTNLSYSSPVQVGSLTNWFMVDSNPYNSAYTTTSNTLYVTGFNISGQLGLGDTTHRSSPTQVGSLTNWKMVALGNANQAGQGFCVAVKNETDGLVGTLWSWGHNLYGQLGYSASPGTSSPQQIGSVTNWTQVAAGPTHAFAITSVSGLWAWGHNVFGQLGLGDTNNRSSPVQIGFDNAWSKVSTGVAHTLAIGFGRLYVWGRNTDGELGLGDTTARSSPVQVGSATNWKQARVGISTSYAINTSGQLFAWGRNAGYELGLGDITSRSSPTQIGSLSSWMTVNTDRTSSAPGSDNNSAVWAVKTDGTLWAWGWNYNFPPTYGPLLGLNTSIITVSSPTQVGSLTTWAVASSPAVPTYIVGATGIIYDRNASGLGITTGGALWAWGDNTAGQKGITGGTITNSADVSSPVQVGSLTNWRLVSNGYYHTAAIKTDGTLWAWGKNTSGQLGQLNTIDISSPVQVGSLANWKLVSTGHYHTAAIKTDGTLWIWGHNSDGVTGGALGLSDITHRSSPVQVGSMTNWRLVSSGRNHTSAVKTDGTLWIWGYNPGTASLGLSNITSYSSPVQVGSLTNWKQVTSGQSHTIAISSPDLP
jgi:alpha-tubulin suppressor-like RCC1 family protein